ncbi:MAG TPA: substrate-binding domain-containing protein [Casimicrobiaceae bacterium]|jgi:molybdate transport system substrate-binding protein
MPTLHVLSAGAAQGLIESLQREFAAGEGIELRASFNPVGVTIERLLAGEPCDVVVLTAPLLGELAAGGDIEPASIASLGRVHTAIAMRAGDAAPDVSTTAALRAVLLAADAIYLPDVERSTAGAHCAAMFRAMGIQAETGPGLHPWPNGVSAMRELARSRATRPIGCTQATEITFTPGVELLGPLPGEFDLATDYGVAVATRARQQEAAGRFAALLSGPASRELRRRCGFQA